jgi:hypothetical protein
MKKLLLSIALVTFCLTANAQFSLGAGVGVPTGDAGEFTSTSYNLSATYMFGAESDFKFGLSASYLVFSGKTIDLDELGELDFGNYAWLPIATVLNYNVSDKLTVGSDVGYGVGLSPEGLGGGFYLRPNVSYAVGDKTSFNLNYSTISDDGSISSFGLGLAYQF